jgi:hypothetical protein
MSSIQHSRQAVPTREGRGLLLSAIPRRRSKRVLIVPLVLVFGVSFSAHAHDVITTNVTFNREIVRLLNAHCISCHREEGVAFSLSTYAEARPWAKAIAEETLSRRMPPWGAVKGFGDLRDDQGLTSEQLELIVDWEEGGAPEGDEKDLPPTPDFQGAPSRAHSSDDIIISGDSRLSKSITLDGLWPITIPDDLEVQITAELPDGSIEPLLWLQNYKMQFGHPFLLRMPLQLPAGTVVLGVPVGATVALLPLSVPRHQSTRPPPGRQ